MMISQEEDADPSCATAGLSSSAILLDPASAGTTAGGPDIEEKLALVVTRSLVLDREHVAHAGTVTMYFGSAGLSSTLALRC